MKSIEWSPQITKDMHTMMYDDCENLTYKGLPNNMYESLLDSARVHANKVALYEGERECTYDELLSKVDKIAIVFSKKYNIEKGDRVALLMVNSIEFCLAFYALAKIGAIVVAISTKLKSAEISRPLIHSGAEILILDPRWNDNVKDIIEDTKIRHKIYSKPYEQYDNLFDIQNEAKEIEEFHFPRVTYRDIAVIIYTSGTTGVAKGVVLTHLNLLHGIETYRRAFDLTKEDSTVLAVPIFHITGLVGLMGLFIHIGGTIHLLPSYSAKQILTITKQYNITFMHGSPTAFILLLDQKSNFPNLPSLKKLACGSAHMPIETLKKLKEWLSHIDFHTIYGLTETSSPATIFPVDVYNSNKRGSSGIAIPGLKVKVIDDEGNTLEANQEGELCVKGTVVFKEYWNNSNLTHEVLKENWFQTGDIARIDEEGYVFILDRKKDMINRGGEKMYSLEVENIIYEHPTVKEVAIYPVDDDLYGEVPKAVIECQEGMHITIEELKSWLEPRVARYKIPVHMEVIAAMPHTSNGKISKRILKQMYP